MIRLLIVDDHDVVRMGLKQVFAGRVVWARAKRTSSPWMGAERRSGATTVGTSAL